MRPAKDIVYSAVYGTGLGHANRFSVIASKLRRKGFTIVASSWGQGLRYLSSLGLATISVPELDVTWSDEGRMLFKKSIRRSSRLFSSLIKQIITEHRILRVVKPRVVVSDSRLSPLVAAHKLAIPSVVIINQLRIQLPSELGALKNVLQEVPAQILSQGWSLADVILVPDLPPPYTIAEDQVNRLPATRRRLVYSGFLIELKLGCEDEGMRLIKPVLSRARGSGSKIIAFSISGPEATKRHHLLLFTATAKLLSRKRGWVSVISGGVIGGSRRPRLLDENVVYYEWCECLDNLLSMSDLVVSRAGHSTVGKLLMLGKPSILLPIPFHGEQASNSLKAERLGVAVSVLRSDLLKPNELAGLIEYVLEAPSYARRAKELSRVARRFNGSETAVNVIARLASGG